MFLNRVLRRIFVPKRKWWEAREDCIMKSFITCTGVYPKVSGLSL
jgi:hypothetical protein